MNALQHLGVDEVINASGRMTRLGVNTLSDRVLDAMSTGGRSYVDIEQLHLSVGRAIASQLDAEDAMVTTGAAAGIAIMVAACVTGDDIARVKALPETHGRPARIVVQAGHQVDFGAEVNQMVRMAGGIPTPIGAVNNVRPAELQAALDGEVAAFLYVQSHHTVQKGMLSLGDCLEICSQRGVPVIVDAAAEEDLTRFVSSGADLVTFSGGKAIGGPTSGIVAGKGVLIDACRAQGVGIGRPMKVGKEQLLGLVVALEEYLNRDVAAERERCSRIVDAICDGLASIDGLRLTRLEDEAGRGIVRAGIQLEPAVARELVSYLESTSPAIFTRTHLLNSGIVAFDPRPLKESQVETIVNRVREFSETAWNDPYAS